MYLLVCCHALFDLQLFISRAGINSCLEDVKTAQKARERSFGRCVMLVSIYPHIKRYREVKFHVADWYLHLFLNDQEAVHPTTINSGAALRESLSHKAPVIATPIASKDWLMQQELEEENSQLMLNSKPCLYC